MSRTKSKLTRALARMTRAFATKDEKAFEEAMDAIEEHVSEDEEKDPDTIEVHNHIPDSAMRDTAIGELPTKEFTTTGPAFDRHGRDEEEAPPWFKKHEEATDRRFKSMSDSIEELLKEKGGEDRRHNDEDVPLEEPDENLEMDDRRSRDEPAERQEMAERIREREAAKDRGNRDRNRDEANKEILGELEFEAPPGTGDKARRAKDSAYLEDAFQETVSRAEVLAPGISLPTFDRKAPPAKTFRAIDNLRKTAIDLAYGQPVTRGVIDQAMSGRTLDSKVMSPAARRVLFNAAAARVGDTNNTRATDHSFSPSNNNQRAGAGGVQSIAQLNARNKEFYANKR